MKSKIKQKNSHKVTLAKSAWNWHKKTQTNGTGEVQK
jgi:hypothetical protein